MNHSADENAQVQLCRQYGREFVPCRPDSKLGLAIATLGKIPINGLRHRPSGDTNGWYIWAGDFSNSADFFAPIHASHIPERLPQVVKYLGLPPGSRFLIAGDYADVWFDDALLKV